MFGSNSPGCPERAADQRVRLAHPFFPNSIVNQHIQLSRRTQRQPLTVLTTYCAVKTSTQIHDGFFRGLSRTPARITQRQIGEPHSAIAAPSPASSTVHFRGGSELYPVEAQTASLCPPTTYQVFPVRNRTAQHHAQQKPVRLLTGPDRHCTTSTSRTPTPANGPCRNRTYNLAIKSRLLCQLS